MNSEHLFVAAFIAGLMSSLHCMGMCGGIASALSMQFKSGTEISNRKVIMYTLAYNLARIFSYTMAGLLLGLLSVVIIGEAGSALFIPLQVLASVILIIIALNILNVSPLLNQLDKLGSGLVPYIRKASQILLPIDSPMKAFALGLVWGWLPCGLVYSMLTIAATTANAMESAMIMFLYGLGTLPAMLAVGLLAELNKSLFQHRLFKYSSAVILIIIAVMPFYSMLTHDHTAHQYQSENSHSGHEHQMHH